MKTKEVKLQRLEFTREEIDTMYEALKALVEIVDVDGSDLEPYFVEPVRQARAIVDFVEAQIKENPA